MIRLKCKLIEAKENYGEAYLIDSGIKDITGTQYLSFAFLYLSSDYYTLAWNGEADFANLERIVLRQLPKKLDLALPHTDISKVKECRVSTYLIVTREDDSLIEYILGERENRDAYHTALKDYRRISFARFDIQHKNQKPLSSYSFSAENSKTARCQSSFTEIAIKQSIQQRIKEDLLNWIMHNHKDYDRFRFHDLDMKQSIDNISNCIYESDMYTNINFNR